MSDVNLAPVEQPPQRRKSRRSWLQVSLRTWLIGFTVLGVGLGSWTASARRQKAAVARLTQFGGTASYDGESAVSLLGYTFFRFTPSAWLEQACGRFLAECNRGQIRSEHDGIRWKYCRNGCGSSTLASEAVSTIAAFPHLRRLLLELDTPIADGDLIRLTRLTELEYLGLNANQLTSEGLCRLQGFPKLNSIILQVSHLSADLTSAISRLPNLEWLWFFEITQLDENALSTLASSPKLTHIAIFAAGHAVAVSDEELAQVARIESLEMVSLDNCGVTENGIDALHSLRNLAFLGLNGLRPRTHSSTNSLASIACET